MRPWKAKLSRVPRPGSRPPYMGGESEGKPGRTVLTLCHSFSCPSSTQQSFAFWAICSWKAEESNRLIHWLCVAKWFIFNVTKQDTHLPMKTLPRWIIGDSDGHLGKEKAEGKRRRGEERGAWGTGGDWDQLPKNYDLRSVSEAPSVGPRAPV